MFDNFKTKVQQMRTTIGEFQENHRDASVAISEIINVLPVPLNSFGRIIWNNIATEENSTQKMLDIFEKIERNNEVEFMRIISSIDRLLEKAEGNDKAILEVATQITTSQKSLQDVLETQLGKMDNKLDQIISMLKDKPVVKEYEKVILPTVEGQNVSFGDKIGIDHLETRILPKMREEKYTTLAIKKGTIIDRYVMKEYLERLLIFDFFEHIVFVDEEKNFCGYVNAKSFYWAFRENYYDRDRHEKNLNEIISAINQWQLNTVPEIMTECITTGENYFDVLESMKTRNNKFLPIVDDDKKFKGILTKEEVLDAIVEASKIKFAQTS